MAASRVMLLVVLSAVSLANVRGAAVDTVTMLTSVTSGYEHLLCSDDDPTSTATTDTVTCDGGPERVFDTDFAATNVIPQVVNVKLKYDGDGTITASERPYFSIVDRTLNGNSPCSSGSYAAASVDEFHTGAIRTGTDQTFSVQASVLLDATAEYEICYSPTLSSDAAYGLTTDAGWVGTGIYLKVSKIDRVTVYGRNFKTEGTIPHHSSLTMTYDGTVLVGRWISFVRETLNGGFPCDDGAEAAAPDDSAHSGSLQALTTSNEFTVDTSSLSAEYTFAVCYAESGGITSSLWRDSGIRVKRSAIHKMYYGVDESRFGAMSVFKRETYNRNTNDIANTDVDTFPRIPGAKLMYEGDLEGSMHISLVDASLNAVTSGTHGSIGNPCAYPKIAAANKEYGIASANTNADSRMFSGMVTATSDKIATIPQDSTNLLDPTKTYAVCYATGDGSNLDTTWADSYARYSITDIESLVHHSVVHSTTGVLPSTTSMNLGYYSATCDTNSATMPCFKRTDDSVEDLAIRFVDATSNEQTTTIGTHSVTIPRPCKATGIRTHSDAGSPQTISDEILNEATKQYFVLDSSTLSTGTIESDDTLTVQEFAVCYRQQSDSTGTVYIDSGIRVSVSKIQQIAHGVTSDATYSKRIMYPVDIARTGATSTVFPQSWEDDSGQSTGYQGLSPGLASSRNVLPQSTDVTITYKSTDASMANKYMSLVDASINGYKPCALNTEAAAEADSTHSGAILSTTCATVGSGSECDIVVPQAPTLLDETKVFAVCYAISTGTAADVTWADSYIRVTISQVTSISSLGVTHSVNAYDAQIASRSQTADASKDSATFDHVLGVDTSHDNLLDLTYVGTLDAGQSLALVDDTVNDGYPCATVFAMGDVDSAPDAAAGPTAGTPTSQTTGPIVATGNTTLMVTDTLDHAKIFAFCYLHTNGEWYDTGIRVTRSPIYAMTYNPAIGSSSSDFDMYQRHQTSVFRSTNRIPAAANVLLTFDDTNDDATAELSTTAFTYLALVATSLNSGNPCVYEATCEAGPDSLHSGTMKATSDGATTTATVGKIVTVPQATLLDYTETFAVCYTADDVSVTSAWKDSYVRLKVSQIKSLSANLGKWKGECLNGQAGCVATSTLPGIVGGSDWTIGGLTQTHLTYGQLPQMASGDTGLELTIDGSLAASGFVSLVDDSLNPTVVDGITYYEPCAAATATAAADTTQSGVHSSSTGYGFCTVLGGSNVGLCDLEGDGSFTTTCQAGARCRPGEPGTTEGGCGTGGLCSGSQITTIDTSILDKTKTYALCYTETATGTATPAGDATDTWADSGIRITISKISQLLTSSRYQGISARIQTPVFKPTNRLPQVPNQKFTYVGELDAGKKIAIVAIKNTMADTSEDNYPCVDYNFVSGATTSSSDEITADGNKVFTVLQTAALLAETTNYAVCYSEGAASSSNWWLDSGIRLGISKIERMRAWGIDVVTEGDIPNHSNLAAGLALSYIGSLAEMPSSGTNLPKIALVEESKNEEFPCFSGTSTVGETYASTAVAAADSEHSGLYGAEVGTVNVEQMVTANLDTDKTFAVCYCDGPGTTADTTFADSGIRVRVPKVWNVLSASGYTGPNCDITTSGMVQLSGCKEDTKPRDMTSTPMSTNRIANVDGEVLTYIGQLPDAKFLSLVATTRSTSTADSSAPSDASVAGEDIALIDNDADGTEDLSGIVSGNPCVYPTEAAMAADTLHSGPEQADSAGSAVTFNNLANLDTTKTYAVCYAEGTGSLTTDGSTTDTTWRDSFIRLQITQISHLTVLLPRLVPGTTTAATTNEQIPIRTVGQIPNQAASEQVTYQYSGALADGQSIALVDQASASAIDPLTAIAVQVPCTGYATPGTQADGTTTGSVTATGDIVSTMDTSGTKLDHDKVYALCYTSSQDASGWFDSGIRITVPKLTEVEFQADNYPTVNERLREMTSIHLASNKLPQTASFDLEYVGDLDTGRYVSIVDATTTATPCVNPALAAASFSATSSGVLTATTRTVSITQGAGDVYFTAGSIFAVCYSSTTGTPDATDIFWRDSYIRLTISQVTTVSVYGITHQSTGQIPHHPELKVEYAGQLAEARHLVLVDAELASTQMGTASYPMPCADVAVALAGASTQATAYGTAGAADKVTEMSTIDLEVQASSSYDIRYWDDMGSATTEKYYAVCYSDEAGTPTALTDSGIRLTVPEIINLQLDSGYSDTMKVCITEGTTPGSTCDSDFDGAKSETCARNLPCTDNAGCGTGTVSGVCWYQEICTSTGGTNIGSNCDGNWDGTFGELCVVNAQCNSQNSYNGGCGTDGVCARQGTSVRKQMAWDQTDGTTVIENPTNRLINDATMELTVVPHWTASTAIRTADPGNCDNDDADADATNACTYMAVVDISLDSDNPGNPCILPAIVAATGIDGETLGATAANERQTVPMSFSMDSSPTIELDQSSDALDTTKTYTVCYAKGGGTNQDITWRDSYIRFKVSQVSSLITLGVTHKTTGQVPNVVPITTGVGSDATPLGVRFTYTGSLAVGSYLSLVDETLNSGLPCNDAAIAGNAPSGDLSAWSDKDTHSGPHQARASGTDVSYVQSFDTTYMDTTKTFALCYATGAGDDSDASWADSGLRLTLPKIYGVQYYGDRNGARGPDPLNEASTEDSQCRPEVDCTEKEDTMPRTQTSDPVPMNRFPRGVNDLVLIYQGALADGLWMSLAAVDGIGGLNPCVYPALAGGPLGAQVSGSQQASGSNVTIPQTTAFTQGAVFAVCYSEARGDATDHTWRDSYIRLTASDVEKLRVRIPTMSVATGTGTVATTDVYIANNGQIPNQAANEQVKYFIDGPLAASGGHIAFVDAVGSQVTATAAPPDATTQYSGVANYNPCSTAVIGSAYTVTATTGEVQNTLDTSTGFLTSKTYALCYTTDGGTTWVDSSLRITVPKLTSVAYAGLNNDVLPERIRTMTSIYRATNKLPAMASTAYSTHLLGQLTYAGDIASNERISLVDASLNAGNPCVNPYVAAAPEDSTHSGELAAATKTATVTQSTLLDADTLFAVCYSDGDGAYADVTWRDSYIRMGVSQVALASTHGVTHKTTGQIPSHPDLQLSLHTSFSSAAEEGTFTLIDASLAAASLGYKTYPFPCSTFATSHNADSATNSISSSVSVSSDVRTVELTTSNLASNPINAASGALNTGADTPAAGDKRYYAVCYTTANDATSTNILYDTGIRVTVPEVVIMQSPSGYGANRRTHLQAADIVGTADGDGSAWRDMTSEALPTNRLPQANAQQLYFIYSSTSNACLSAAEAADTTCANGDGKFISLVDETLNGGNPCVLTSETEEASADGQHSGILTAVASSKRVQVDALTLDSSVTFAVCYSKGNKLWDPDPSNWAGAATVDGTSGFYEYWEDSYVRLKISKVEAITTLGVTHRTYGQVPNTVSTDGLSFTYSGTLGESAYIALVDAGVGDGDPCSEGSTVSGSQHSGAVQAGEYRCAAFDTTNALSNCGAGGTDACAQNTICDPASNGCGDAGLCRASVTSFETHTLATTASSSEQYVGASDTTSTERLSGEWYAVCYAESGAPTVWSDSGIRVTVPKVYNVRLGSTYTGTPDRDHTSLFLSTNRLAQSNDQRLTYYGDAADGIFFSLVKVVADSVIEQYYNRAGSADAEASMKSWTGNPCVKGNLAAAAAAATGDSDYSGVKEGGVDYTDGTEGTLSSSRVIDFDPTRDRLPLDETFALCYNEASDASDATTTSYLWKDSYIRFKLTAIETFSTKDVSHKTTGQIPHHPTGLRYTYDGTLSTDQNIALVDASLNTQYVVGYGESFAQPCNADYASLTDSDGSWPGDDQHTGALTANSRNVEDLDTTPLDTSKTFALCYSSNSLGGASGAWEDSGIRLTISQLDTIHFSGYDTKYASEVGKAERGITSTLPLLQVGNVCDVDGDGVYDEACTLTLAANVLPEMTTMPLRYSGDLGHSRYVSLVAVASSYYGDCDVDGDTVDEPCVPTSRTTTSAQYNPCVDPTLTTVDGSMARACHSYEDQCEFSGHGDGSDANQNKELHIAGALDPDFVYAVCYADVAPLPYDNTAGLQSCYGDYCVPEWGDAATIATLVADPYDASGRTITGSPVWVDSYIRVQVSKVATAIATGVTHTDHGHLANHELAAKLPIEYTGSLPAYSWFSLVYQQTGDGVTPETTGESAGVSSANEPCLQGSVAAAHAYECTQDDGGTPASSFGSTCDVDGNGVFDETCATGEACDPVYDGCGTGGTCTKNIERSGAFQAGTPILHKLKDESTDCGYDWSGNDAMGTAVATNANFAQFQYGEPADPWACAKDSSTYSSYETYEVTDTSSPYYGKYVVEYPDSSTVYMLTDGLDTTKVFALCYSEGLDGSGDLDYSPATIGTRTWKDSGIRVSLTEVHTIRDNRGQLPLLKMDASDSIFTSRFARDLTSSRTKVGRTVCLKVSTMAGTIQKSCDADGDGVYTDTCVVGAFCDPDAPYNGGCGILTTAAAGSDIAGLCNSGAGVRALTSTSGDHAAWTRTVYNFGFGTPHHKLRAVSSGNLELEYFGDLSSTNGGANDFFVAATTLNNNEPCADPAWASAVTAGAQNTARLSAASFHSADEKGIQIDAATLATLDTSLTYTLCYACDHHATDSVGCGSSGYKDAYIHFSVSAVSSISTHGVTHQTQGHIPNGVAVGITYDGTLADASYLALVAEETMDFVPCSDATAAADTLHSAPAQAGALSTTVQFDTTGLSTEVNFAVCYSADGVTYTDSGIRVSVARLTTLTFNKQTLSIGSQVACAPGVSDASSCYLSQQGTVDYQRTMTSTNVAPASDTFPIATNTLSTGSGLVDLEYKGNLANNGGSADTSLADGEYFNLVKVSTNGDSNPCVTQCSSDAACDDGSTDGVFSTSASTSATGKIQATASSKVFRVDQETTGLDSTVGELYAVCYSQGEQANAAAGVNVDTSAWRDSYIRLKPSKVHTFSVYGIDHYTFGDIPSKETLTVEPWGTVATGAIVSLVDQLANNEQPCTGTYAGQSYDSLATADKQLYTGESSHVYKCARDDPSVPPSSFGDSCDANNDGVFDETCEESMFCDATDDGCGTGGTCTATEYDQLTTSYLDSDRTFAVCYTENGGGSSDAEWVDAGIRVKTPQVQSISYSSPARVISADSCFTSTVQDEEFDHTSDDNTYTGIADCHVRLEYAFGAPYTSDAHYQRGAMLPRSADAQITYHGALNTGTALATGKWLSLVEQSQRSTNAQRYNPCRDAPQAAGAPDLAGATGVGDDNEEGGMRVHSGPLQDTTGTSTVTIPQAYDRDASIYNMLDYTKTYAVCYSDGDGATDDEGWRDSYIRITLSKIMTLKAVHDDDAGDTHSAVEVTTIGTFANVPSLYVQWEGSLLHDRWLRFTHMTYTGAESFSGAPCDKQHADTSLSATTETTTQIQSGTSDSRVTFDTSVLANPGQEAGYYAVCYATGDGSSSDDSWHDSGIRLRFVRWSNPEKSRIVSGAPARLTFSISTGIFDSERDKVVFLREQPDCSTAIAAPSTSSGTAVSRTIDFVCTTVSGDAASTCDSDFDGEYAELCHVGALCDTDTSNSGTNGGCGSSGTCSASVQLPSGASNAEPQDSVALQEVALTEGHYAVCLCLGGTDTGTAIAATSTSYGPANGNGGCDAGSEYTLIGSNLQIVSKPKIGRVNTDGDTVDAITVRAVADATHTYRVTIANTASGFGIAAGDKIFFVPSSLGCGHRTQYSGDGEYAYHGGDSAVDDTWSYIAAEAVDRRWRASVTTVCTTIGTVNVGSNCRTSLISTTLPGYTVATNWSPTNSASGGYVTTDYEEWNEQCALHTLCDIANANNGGCGDDGVCGSPVPAADLADRTSPITLATDGAYSTTVLLSTPAGTKLTTAQQMSACFATQESLAGSPTDSTDYTELDFGLEVVDQPSLGPVDAPPGRIYAIENSSPSFQVNSMTAQDMYYFVPQVQTQTTPNSDDCVPHVCTSIGGSNIGTTQCDADHDGTKDDACVVNARCDPTAEFNGYCGTTGTCAQRVPTVNTMTHTGLLEGASFSTTDAGLLIGQLTLPADTTLAVPPYQTYTVTENIAYTTYPTAWYLVTCMIPAGAITDDVSNVVQLDDILTVIKEPTELITASMSSWFQGQVHELQFTQPQQQMTNLQEVDETLATGLPGDIVVLKKDNCTGVHEISGATTDLDGFTDFDSYWQSSRFTLVENGGVTGGDVKGGTAREKELAIGKVNELQTGIYKICYATAASEGESQTDFVELDQTIEILPAPATRPSLSAPRSVILGQDVVVSWASNIGLSEWGIHNNVSQDIAKSTQSAWVGLFEKDSCTDTHDCYLAYQFISTEQLTGTVIFSQRDYKYSGEYEVRYFKGDTRNGQGVVCKGQAGNPTETYVECVLAAATTSETITVAGQDIDETEDLSLRPGLEAVFGNGNRGRYHRTKLT